MWSTVLIVQKLKNDLIWTLYWQHSIMLTLFFLRRAHIHLNLDFWGWEITWALGGGVSLVIRPLNFEIFGIVVVISPIPHCAIMGAWPCLFLTRARDKEGRWHLQDWWSCCKGRFQTINGFVLLFSTSFKVAITNRCHKLGWEGANKERLQERVDLGEEVSLQVWGMVLWCRAPSYLSRGRHSVRHALPFSLYE